METGTQVPHNSVETDAKSSEDDSIGPLPDFTLGRSIRPVCRPHPTDGTPLLGISYSGRPRSAEHSQGSSAVGNQPSPTRHGLPPRSPSRSTHSLLPPSAFATKSPKLPRRRHSGTPRSHRRPDPPEQIQLRSIPSKSKNQSIAPQPGKKLDESFPDRPLRRAKSLETPKQPCRTASLPILGRAKPQASVQAAKTDRFIPRPCKSIARAFPESKMDLNEDVWVQRMVLRGDGKEPQFFFKSVFSKESKLEPPTGALNIIYMDELVKIQEPKKNEKVPDKKKSFWSKMAKGTESCGSSPPKPGRTWSGFGRKL